jgi:hypothetical protein
MCNQNLVYIPLLWKWWIVAMLNLCKNLVYNFVLYEYLNLLVYFEKEREIKLCGQQMLMTKPRVLTSMIWCDDVNLALSHSMVKISDEFLLKIKQDKFLNDHITYPSHMSISKYKPSTYACLWPIEFCQIVVTLGRIFSCFRDRNHVHPHI